MEDLSEDSKSCSEQETSESDVGIVESDEEDDGTGTDTDDTLSALPVLLGPIYLVVFDNKIDGYYKIEGYFTSEEGAKKYIDTEVLSYMNLYKKSAYFYSMFTDRSKDTQVEIIRRYNLYIMNYERSHCIYRYIKVENID